MKLLTPSRSASRSVTRRDVLKGSVAGAVALSLPRTSRGLILPGGSAQASPGQPFDFYISTTGNDANDGLTPATAWAITSLRKSSSNNALIAGKRVGLLPGTYQVYTYIVNAWTSTGGAALSGGLWGPGYGDGYTGAFSIPGGSSGSPTYIGSSDAAGNYSPRTATIECDNAGANFPPCQPVFSNYDATNRQYVTIDGLVITKHGGKCLYFGFYSATFNNYAGITVQNCEEMGASGANINSAQGGNYTALVEMAGLSGASILNNYIHANLGVGGARSADHFTGTNEWWCESSTYRFNTVVDTPGLFGKEYGSYGTLIEKNYIDASGWSGTGTGLQDFSGGNTLTPALTTVIRNNVIIATQPGYLEATLGGSGWTCALHFYSNTILGDPSSGFSGIGAWMFEQSGRSRDFQFYSNIVHSNSGATPSYGELAGTVNGFYLCDYNQYGQAKWGTVANGTYTSSGIIGYTTLAAWASAIGGAGYYAGASPEAHSVVNSTLGFTGVNTGLLASKYQLTNTAPGYGTGSSDGTPSGTTVNIGAWDGIVTQIGCDFA